MINFEADLAELKRRQEEYCEVDNEYWVIERQIQELVNLAVDFYGYECVDEDN